ncbi:MAG TPA: hypothetical protein VFZ66_03060 [Herpetosiphonaceae bacterium]
MKTRIGWALGAVLALALVGQLVAYRAMGSAPTAHASWIFEAKTFGEARQKAQAIVLADVIAVEQGDDLVVKVPAEPNGEARYPTQRVSLRVIKGYQGAAKADAVITLFQTGGSMPDVEQTVNGKALPSTAQVLILEGDPLYQVGERYLLLLEPGPRAMLRTISPEGRYRVGGNGTLTAMVDKEATREVHGKSLAHVEKLLVAGR